jgi:hypothetical protein
MGPFTLPVSDRSDPAFKISKNLLSRTVICIRFQNALTVSDWFPIARPIFTHGSFERDTIPDLGNTPRKAASWPSCRSTTNGRGVGSEFKSAPLARRYYLTCPRKPGKVTIVAQLVFVNPQDHNGRKTRSVLTRWIVHHEGLICTSNCAASSLLFSWRDLTRTINRRHGRTCPAMRPIDVSY